MSQSFACAKALSFTELIVDIPIRQKEIPQLNPVSLISVPFPGDQSPVGGNGET
jgi:hypothetical protein